MSTIEHDFLRDEDLMADQERMIVLRELEGKSEENTSNSEYPQKSKYF